MTKPLKRQLACAWALNLPLFAPLAPRAMSLPLRRVPRPSLQPGSFRQARAFFEGQGGATAGRRAGMRPAGSGTWEALCSWTRHTLRKRHRGERRAYTSRRPLPAVAVAQTQGI